MGYRGPWSFGSVFVALALDQILEVYYVKDITQAWLANLITLLCDNENIFMFKLK